MPLGNDHASPEDAADDAAALGDVDIVALLAQLPDDVLLYDRRGRLVHATLDSDLDGEAGAVGATDLRGPVRSAIEDGRSTSRLVPAAGPDGAEVTRFATIGPLRSRDGSIEGAVVVLRNEPSLDERLDAERSHDFDSLAASLPDIIVRFDAGGRLCYENGRLSEQVALGERRLLGGRPSDFVGHDVDGVPEFDAALQRVLRTGEHDEARLAFSAPDGTRRVHAVRFRPDRGLDGTIVGAFAIGREITELEHTRGELERRESEIRSLADGIPDVVLRYDLEGRVTFANRHWIESLGRDPEYILGKRPTESARPGTVGVDEYEAILMRVIETGEPAGTTIRLTGSDGDLRTHSVYFRAHRGEDGAIVGAIAIGRDITALVRAEQRALDREREFRTLAENLPDVVHRFGRDGRVRYSNRRLSQVVPGGTDEVGLLPTEHDLPGIVNLDEYERVLMQVLETGEDATTEVHQVTETGERREFQVVLCAELDDDGEIVGAVSIARDVTDLLRAQEAEIARAREFRTLAENLPDVVNRLDRDGRVRYANRPLSEVIPGASDDLGFRPSEKELPGISNVEDYERVLAQVLTTGEDGVTEIHQSLPSGERRTHQILLCAERDADGDIVGAISIARDVTDLITARQKAVQRETKFRTLAENLPDVVLRYDVDGRVVYSSGRLHDIVPDAAGDIGTRLTEHDLPGIVDVEAYERTLMQVLSSGEQAVHEVRQVLPSGAVRLHHVLICAERDEHGEIVGAISIGRNVTDLVEAQQQVAEREREFRSLAENNTDFIARYDPDGVRIYVNPALAELYGVEPDELIGQSVSAMADGASGVVEAIHGVIDDRRARSVTVRVDRSAGGVPLVHDVRVVPEFDADGEFVSVLAIGRDVTDLVSARQEAAEREREFRTLAENNTDYIARYDLDGVRTYVNPALARMHGTTPDALIGQPAADTLGDRSDMLDVIAEVVREGEPRVIEQRSNDPATGDEAVHHVQVIPEFGTDGRMVGVLAIGRDVTDLALAQQRVAEREREFRTLAENNTDYVSRFDRHGVRTYVNRSLARLYRKSPEELVGRRVTSDDPDDSVSAAVLDVIADQGPRQLQWCWTNPRTGKQVVHQIQVIPEFDIDGQFVSVLTIGHDVTALIEAQQQVTEREREFRTLAENNTDYIARWDTDGVRTYVNPALATLHAQPVEELVGHHVAALGDRSDVVGPAVLDVITDGLPRNVQQRFVDPITGDLTMHDVRLIPEFDNEGTLVSVLGIGRDVTEALRHQDELARAASTDVLTGVASRGVLYERLPEVIEARRADGNGGALILLDLDGFKAINDHFGHQFGDRILQEAAHRLRQCIGPDDLLVRLGGDEFVVILSRIDTPGDASLVAHRARTQLTSLTHIDGVRVPPVDVCMGIAFLPSDGADVDELLAHADLALYEAKRRGRGHVEYFRRDLRAAMERRTTLEHALRACDPDTEMSVHLQPIYRLGGTSTVWGAEALLRWDHPELGSVRPDEFIPIAEQTGDIIALGRWVLRQVAELAVVINTRRAVPLQFAVNVSSRQFTLGDIEDAVREAMATTGVDPRWLTLELTESLLLDDIPQVNRSLRTLSELGVSLAIDDFGTGYSALQYLTRLDIDCLKIDRSFVHGSEVDVQQREIVRAIVALASALGIGIVAEGIETTTQASFLHQLGCELGQGYLLARPMPSADFETWLAASEADVAPAVGG